MHFRTSRHDNILTRLFSKSKIVSLLGLILAVGITYSLIKKIEQQRTINNEVDELAEEIESLEGKNSELKEMIDYLESYSFLEKEARVNLDMKKPGEKVVVINDADDNGDEEKETESVFVIPGLDKQVETEEISNPQKWWGYFFGIHTN